MTQLTALDPSLSEHGPPVTPSRWRVLKLTLGALGVVYGDIGTSPLYAFRECFSETHGVAATPANVLGVTSLIFWSLTIVVCIKYLAIVVRADDRGEGGILALLALNTRGDPSRSRWLITIGLVGSALMLADAVITPAISVLGAVEGVAVAAPGLESNITPLAVSILAALFLLQSRGTAALSKLFGPIAIAWFASIFAAGLPWIARQPEVLGAVNPLLAVRFAAAEGGQAFILLGAIVLTVTGAEALYADLGHFGKTPIRLGWYLLVYPSLLASYFGQAALMLERNGKSDNPFFDLVPEHLLYPMIGVATAAAIIASQAVISGMFSLGKQAVLLGYLPRLAILHTSAEQVGQVYLPAINFVLASACIALAAGFGSSSALAGAYGIAVMGTMTITSMLLITHGFKRWGPGVVAISFLFLAADSMMFVSTLFKTSRGGWLPLLTAIAATFVMLTWRHGTAVAATRQATSSVDDKTFLEQLSASRVPRVTGTGIFLARSPDMIPVVLLHHLSRNKVLHEQVVLVTVLTVESPRVHPRERVRVHELGLGLARVIVRYGYMETPNLPDILDFLATEGVAVDPADLTFYVGRTTYLVGRARGFERLRMRLFTWLARNSRPAVEFFGVPTGQLVELGILVEV